MPSQPFVKSTLDTLISHISLHPQVFVPHPWVFRRSQKRGGKKTFHLCAPSTPLSETIPLPVAESRTKWLVSLALVESHVADDTASASRIF